MTKVPSPSPRTCCVCAAPDVHSGVYPYGGFCERCAAIRDGGDWLDEMITLIETHPRLLDRLNLNPSLHARIAVRLRERGSDSEQWDKNLTARTR